MDTLTKLRSMTHDELLNYTLDLEKTKEKEVYVIAEDDLFYVMSTMLSIPETFVSNDLVEKAKELMKGRFTITEETTQIADFLEAQAIDWKAESEQFSGYVDAKGKISISLVPTSPEESVEPFLYIFGDDDTSRFLLHVLGEDWFEKVQESPYFHFTREDIEDADF